MQHEPPPRTVLNQTPPLGDYNLYATDAALQDALRRKTAGEAERDLLRAGA